MPNSASKTFHFEGQNDYALMVLFDSWVALTALLEASTSILEREGYDLTQTKAATERGDRALVALLRRDRTSERQS